MSEENISPDGQAGSGGNPDTTQRIAELQRQLDYMKAEAGNAFKTRDEVKAKLKELQDAEEMKKGNYEKLLSEREQELGGLRTEIETLSTIKTEFEKLQSYLKDELLSQLSEDHKAIASSLDLEKLRAYVKINSGKTPGMDTGRPGGNARIDISGKEWDDFSIEELRQLKQANKSAYSELYKKKYNQRLN